jgi:hypothetical protein
VARLMNRSMLVELDTSVRGPEMDEEVQPRSTKWSFLYVADHGSSPQEKTPWP